mmetsp:Transcript_12489/g.36839  ORF Transcript_12489/g.36839 Transcript_12489/m.36839 type:complete len:594 (-) Transcript_12489:555-2336(-)
MTTTVCLTLRVSSDNGDDVALRLNNRDGEEVTLSTTDLIVAANSSRRSFHLSRSGADVVYLEARAITPLPASSSSSSSSSKSGGGEGGEGSILPWREKSIKVSSPKLLSMVFPTMLLAASIAAYWTSGASGYAAIFPSTETFGVVLKLTLWMCTGLMVAYEHVWLLSSHPGRLGGQGTGEVKLRVTIEGWASEGKQPHRQQHQQQHQQEQQQQRQRQRPQVPSEPAGERASVLEGTAADFRRSVPASASPFMNGSATDSRSVPAKGGASRARENGPIGERAAPGGSGVGGGVAVKRRSASSKGAKGEAGDSAAAADDAIEASAAGRGLALVPFSDSSVIAAPATQALPPERFIKAEKGDILSAQQRYEVTLAWRKEMNMDAILSEPHPNFDIIKKNYPHFYHFRGLNNEPCYYECPPKMKLQTLRDAGVSMDDLLRHYAMTCEFMWTHIEPSEEGKSIYVIDLEGMGIRDFAGDAVDFVKRTSAFTSAHYPERSGSIFIVNVPSWFSIIWNTVKPWVDEVTRQKIKILKSGKAGITRALEKRVAIENIPPEYGGKSVPLGQAPEEIMFREKIASNNKRYQAKKDGLGESSSSS